MYRIIIWEGCDCCGKSTLKERYDRKFGFRDLSVDRMFISGIVYNKVKDRNKDLENQIYDDLRKFVETFKPVFIHVKCDPKVIYERFKSRGDDIITSFDDILKITDEYNIIFELLSQSDLRELEYNIIEADGNSEDIDKELERIHGLC